MTTAKWIWRLALSILLGKYDHRLLCYFKADPWRCWFYGLL